MQHTEFNFSGNVSRSGEGSSKAFLSFRSYDFKFGARLLDVRDSSLIIDLHSVSKNIF